MSKFFFQTWKISKSIMTLWCINPSRGQRWRTLWWYKSQSDEKYHPLQACRGKGH